MRKVISIFLTSFILAVTFTGCSNPVDEAKQILKDSIKDAVSDALNELNIGDSTGSGANSDTPEYRKDIESRLVSEQQYKDFLEGKSEVYFEQEFSGVKVGKYDIAQLKNMVQNCNGVSSIPKYYILNYEVNNKPVTVLVLRFESTQYDFLNTAFFIVYKGDKLYCTDYYDDGYRTFSNVYENGYLEIGGSYSAGSYGYTYYKLNENGSRDGALFNCEYYSESWVGDIVYDLSDDYSRVMDCSDFDMSIEVLSIDGEKKVAVTSWSDDSNIRKREEAHIEKLKTYGVSIISTTEFDDLLKQYSKGENKVAYANVSNGVLYPKAAAGETLIAGDFVSKAHVKEDIFNYPEYEENNFNSDYTMVKFAEEVYNISVDAITLTGNLKDNKLVAKRQVLVEPYKNGMGPEEVMYLGISYPGDLPTYGITFTDGMGNVHHYAIEISGKDGSLIFTEIYVEE